MTATVLSLTVFALVFWAWLNWPLISTIVEAVA